MKFFGKDKKTDPVKEGQSEISSDSLEGFEEALETTLREENTQIIAAKTEQSRAKAMVRTLLDAGYSIDEINTLVKAGKTFSLKAGQTNIK